MTTYEQVQAAIAETKRLADATSEASDRLLSRSDWWLVFHPIQFRHLRRDMLQKSAAMVAARDRMLAAKDAYLGSLR